VKNVFVGAAKMYWIKLSQSE